MHPQQESVMLMNRAATKGLQITHRDADSLHAVEGGVAETWLAS